MSVVAAVLLFLLGLPVCRAAFTTHPSLSASGAGEAVVALLEADPQPHCSILLLTDGTTPPYTIFKLFNQTESFVGVFEVAADGQDANVTQEQLSRLVGQARRVRQSSWCVTVVVVSDDPAFLATFAQWSLKGRLLVWPTRLLALTRLPLHHLHRLLTTHWTFSMMNAIFLNLEDATSSPRWRVWGHLPYTGQGPQTVSLASWTTGSHLRLEDSLKLFPEKFLNFHGARVNVTALPYAPHWMEATDQAPDGALIKRYSGTDYLLLKTVADTLNFTFVVLHSETWDAVVERVEKRVSFMVAQFFNVLPQRLKKYDFSFTYEFASLDLCAAKPRLRPQWQSLYYPLSHGVWLALLATLLVLPVTFYMINLVDAHRYLGKTMDAETAFQMVVATFLAQNLTKKLPKRNTSRVLVAGWLVFAFIIGTVYRGNLTASLTLPKYPPRPETIEQFVNTFDRITMPPWGRVWIIYFRQSDSVVFKALAERIAIVPTVLGGLQRAKDGKEAHVAGRPHMEQKIAKHFSKVDGSTQLYVGRESIFPGLSAWPIPHDAPYRPQLDHIMMAVVEAGVYEKWRRDTLDEARRESREKQLLTEEGEEPQPGDRKAALNLVHIQGPLLLLLLGHVAAVLGFIAEIRNKIIRDNN